MLVRATHRADGKRAGRHDEEPFLAFIELPAEPIVASGGQSIVRVRGWVAPLRGQAPRAAIKVGGGAWLPVAVDQDRVDVLEHFRAVHPDFPVTCGFSLPVTLPDVHGPTEVPLVVEVGDGEYVGRARYTIRHTDAPPPRRSDYKTVWQSVSRDPSTAKVAVLGTDDEEVYAESARETVARLERTVGIGANDVVLEIGAGVGRLGRLLASRCARWIACDVSPNMLAHARARCEGLDNVDFVELNGWDLSPIAAESIDVVYSTVVFMHLDEWERYSYVCEAMRVLRPGGRVYVDNLNLRSEPGWEVFLDVADGLHPLERPPNVSKMSTPDELRTFLERAGFDDVVIESPNDQWWVAAYGRKTS